MRTPALDQLMRQAASSGATDLHLQAERPPLVRVQGRLEPLPEAAPLEGGALRDALLWLAGEARIDRLTRAGRVRFTYSDAELKRWRVQLYEQPTGLGCSLRRLHPDPQATQLGLPRAVQLLAMATGGLVLVAGPGGSGVSTTMAAMIALINTGASRQILTLEDPVEYLFEDRKSFCQQRELGRDFPTFAMGVRQARRLSPDVLLIGDLPDPATILEALLAAETGILVIAGMRASVAGGPLQRLVHQLPAVDRPLACAILAHTLRGAIGQVLLYKRHRTLPACEVLMASPELTELLDRAALDELPALIARGEHGTLSIDDALHQRVVEDRIATRQVRPHARDAGRFARD